MKYRVLSVDGGGIRGLVAAVVLKRICETPGLEDFLDSIDFVAGTSTGGLLALGIAGEIGIDEIIDLYTKKGPKIFSDSLFDDIIDLGKLRGADYDIEPLQGELRRIFGDATLGQLKKRVLVTSLDLDNECPQKRMWEPKLFHNFDEQPNDRNEMVRNAGLYTAAAPTYFPTVDGFIDGGVYAKNPAMCAVAHTQDKHYSPTPGLDEVVVFSLGTGITPRYIEGKNLDWGFMQWMKPLTELMLEGSAEIVDYQCRRLLEDHYHRLEPIFPEGVHIPMDDVKKIPFMETYSHGLNIDGTVDWIRRYWKPKRRRQYRHLAKMLPGKRVA